MALDAFKNLAYSTVATAPDPATTGPTLVVAAGHGTRFPTAPFNATVWPADAIPTPSNAEVVRVTAVDTDTLTIEREQENTTARAITVGDQIAASITALTLATLETDIAAADTHAGTASAVAAAANVHANAASAAATVADTHAATASAAATSADGHAAAVSVLAAAASALATTADTHANTASAAATSADGHAAAVSVIAAAASAAATAADTHAGVASAAATSANARLDAVSCLSGAGTAVGLQSVVNALSASIAAIPGAGSATIQTAVLGTSAVISAATLTAVTGLSVPVSAGVSYQIEGFLMVNRGAAAQVYGYGLTFPAAKHSRGAVSACTSSTGAGLAALSVIGTRGIWTTAGSTSVIASTISTARVSVYVEYNGVLVASAAGAVVPSVKASAGAGAATLLPGSYFKLLRLST